jgi:serine/threonine-protein kinase
MAASSSCPNGHAINSEDTTCPQCGTVLGLEPVPPAEEPALPAVPGYEVQGVLGKGGMGVVYKARQQRLDRVVALKMIRDVGLAGPEEVQRFRVEAEAAARLQHPNVVQLHEVAEYAGRPYLVFEYLDGGSLAHQLAGAPQPPRAGAELVERLARAMHHAHQQGIIHRDLKPANVLLTADGTPKITDFGLARRAQSERLTQTGQVLGTPAYMAPEQALGRPAADPRIDVYALGAILYETLTGRPPFQGETPLDTLEQVVAREPVPPRLLQPKVPVDLQTIALKCLEKAPDRRYGSAQELADDLARFLRGEPIRARPASLALRLRKWARRQPAVAALLAVSSLALVAGGVGAFWHVRSLRAEVARADAHAAEALHQQERAEEYYERALAAVDQMLTRVGADRLARIPAFEEERRKLLEDALTFYQGFLQERDNPQARVRYETARAQERIASLSAKLERFGEAEQAYQQALALLEPLVAEHTDDIRYRQELAVVHQGLGLLYQSTRRPRQAETVLQRALAVQEALVRADPQRPGAQDALAALHDDLGSVFLTLGNRDKAEAAHQKALDLHQQLSRDYPDKLPYAVGVGGSACKLAAVAARLGKANQALDGYALAIRTLDGVLARDPGHEVAQDFLRQALTGRTDVLEKLGRREEALSDTERELALDERLTREHPKVPIYEHALAITHGTRGRLYHRLGRLDQAEIALRKAVALQEALVQALVPDYPRGDWYRAALAVNQDELGTVYLDQRRFDQAEAAHCKALALRQQLAQEHPGEPGYQYHLASSYNNLANVYLDTGRRAQAEATYKETLAIKEQLACNHPEKLDYTVSLGGCYGNLGSTVLQDGRRQAALAWYDRSIETLEPVLQQEARHANARLFLRNAYLGRREVLQQLSRYPEALPACERALALDNGQLRDQLRIDCAALRARLGQHIQATAEANTLAEQKSLPPALVYDVACVYALAAQAASTDDQPATPDRAQRIEDYARRAGALLAQAQAAGFFKSPARIDHLKKDPDLDSLRMRADYQRLLSELEKATEAEPEASAMDRPGRR